MTTQTVARIDGPLDATVSVPGSKSIANRALICAALADGRSVVTNLPDGDDVVAMLRCLARLGVGVQAGEATVIDGVGTPSPAAGTVLDTGLAGTTSRFLVAVGALSATPVTVDGDDPLRRRPFGPLVDALSELGATITHPGAAGHLPLTISGPLPGSSVAMRGDVSSQFISALMMIGPLMPRGVEITIAGDLISEPYVALTEAVMAGFGATVDTDTTDGVRIQVAPARYRPATYQVEPDASSASYPLGLAAIIGGSVTVNGLGTNSRQGDAAFAEILGDMGCDVVVNEHATTVKRSPDAVLHGVDIDMANVSDLVPTLAAVAAVASSPTRIRGVGFIRAKESDRLGDLAREFTKLGVTITERPDGLDIEPSAHSLRPARVATYHDHRLAMAAGLLGSAIGGVEVDDPAVVSKSWPSFWSMLDEVGI